MDMKSHHSILQLSNTNTDNIPPAPSKSLKADLHKTKLHHKSQEVKRTPQKRLSVYSYNPTCQYESIDQREERSREEGRTESIHKENTTQCMGHSYVNPPTLHYTVCTHATQPSLVSWPEVRCNVEGSDQTHIC